MKLNCIKTIEKSSWTFMYSASWHVVTMTLFCICIQYVSIRTVCLKRVEVKNIRIIWLMRPSIDPFNMSVLHECTFPLGNTSRAKTAHSNSLFFIFFFRLSKFRSMLRNPQCVIAFSYQLWFIIRTASLIYCYANSHRRHASRI